MSGAMRIARASCSKGQASPNGQRELAAHLDWDDLGLKPEDDQVEHVC